MNVVSLCSGVGLIDLGLEWAGMRTVQVCEIDPWCRDILEQRFPDAAVHDDAWTIQPAACDLLAAGFPCQPVSVAGRRAGQDDERWLWPAVERAVRLARPRYVLLENVPGIASLGLGDVLRGLAVLGFDAEWTVFGAWQAGALHRRDRWWLVATSDADQSGLWDEHGGFFRPGWAGEAVAWAHVPTRPVVDTDEEREPQPGGVPDLGRRRSCDGRHPGVVADADEAGRREQRRPLPDGEEHSPTERGRSHAADTQGEREREPADEAVAIATRRDAWPVTRGGGRGITESGVCGVVNGSATRMDGGVDDDREPELRGVWEGAGAEEVQREVGGQRRIPPPKVLQSGLFECGTPEGESDAVRVDEAGNSDAWRVMRALWNSVIAPSASRGPRPDEQLARELADALRGVPYATALGGGEGRAEAAVTYVHGMRKALSALGVVREASHPLEAAWVSLSDDEKEWCHMAARGGPWANEWPGVTRTTTETGNRARRLSALGNGVVPQCVELIGLRIRQLDTGVTA